MNPLNPPKIHYSETKFGFEYGAAKIERCCSDYKKGWVVLKVETKKESLQVYITKTGKIKIHNKQGKELKNDNK